MPRKDTERLDKLLKNWEESYKKGLLSFWILLLLHDRPAYAYELSEAVSALSQGTVSADENSIYRALNRFESLGIITSEWRQSEIGPQRRYYTLTNIGVSLLTRFVQRNILVFDTPIVLERIQAVLGRTNPNE